ncbi:MAG: hypothetical protein R6U51_08290 [Anaerolineales bacterium]
MKPAHAFLVDPTVSGKHFQPQGRHLLAQQGRGSSFDQTFFFQRGKAARTASMIGFVRSVLAIVAFPAHAVPLPARFTEGPAALLTGSFYVPLPINSKKAGTAVRFARFANCRAGEVFMVGGHQYL